MATFDTTMIDSNSPGLTYTSPKDMPAKYNALGGALKVLDTAVKGAVFLDESLTMSAAEREATDLATDYELQSASNIETLQAKQDFLTDQIASNPEADKLPWEKELDIVTNKLTLGKAQGVISPYEFQARAQKAALDLGEKNPAYVDKIAAKMNQVFNRGMTSTLLKADIDAIEFQRKAEAAAFKEKTDYLTTQGLVWQNMDQDEIEINYLQEKQQQRDDILLEREVAAKTRYSEEEKQIFASNIKKDFPSSGIYGAAQERWDTLFRQLELLEDSDMPVDQKNDIRQRLVGNSYQYLDWFVGNQPSTTDSEKANLTRFHTNQKELIKSLEDEFKKNIPGNKKDFLTEQRDIFNLSNEIVELRNGFNRAKVENLKLTVETWAILTSGNLGVTATITDAEVVDLKKGLFSIINREGGKLAPDSPGVEEWKALNSYKALSSFSNLAAAELKQGELQVTTKGFFNNLFLKVDGMSGNNKFIEQDKLLPLLTTQIDKSVLDTLMQNGDFSASMLNNLAQYKEALITTIPDGLELIMVDGLFYYPSDTKVNKNVMRLNNYVLLQAKIQGKKPSEISQDILNTEFPMFNIKGQAKQSTTTGRKWTYEEAQANPSAVGDNDIVVLPDGREVRKPK